MNYESTTIIATWKTPELEKVTDEDKKIYSLLIPQTDTVPYVKLYYGASLLEDIEISDPDDALRGERMYLTVSNHTQSDIWVEWFRDVHEDHKLDLVRNNSQKQRKTRKVGSGGAAVPLKFYRNRGGTKGKYLGSTTVKIEWTLAEYEHIELVREGDKMHVVSLVQLPRTILAIVYL